MHRSCLHELHRDPPTPPRAHTNDMVLDAGTGLTNVVLWDLAFLVFAANIVQQHQNDHHSKALGKFRAIWFAHLG